jgi:hypothetical protein
MSAGTAGQDNAVTKISTPQTPEKPKAAEERPAKGGKAGKPAKQAVATPPSTPPAAQATVEERSWAAPGGTEASPGKPQKKSDGFETGKAQQKQGDARAPAPVQAVPIPGASPGALSALHQAREPGVLFEEQGHQGGHGEADTEDPELAAAVEEAIHLLFGVRGIHRIAPGRNEAKEPVVLVVANRGFTEKSMTAVPPRVRQFATLVALPYDLLPLRRE